jgi:hypothetical protein|tara:strand:- start:437 stop:1438 length:1002 start_codon:yes stop_codon:yes gene_type:complete
MQTRQYKDLFALSTHLIGAVELTTDEQTQLATFIDRRFFEAFRKSPFWPRYMVYGEPRAIASYELSNATSSTSTAVNGKYKFFGVNSGSFEAGGGSATADTNIYQNTDSTTTFIYKNSSNAWVVATGINPTDTRSSEGKISLNGSGTVQFTEADTTKNDTVEGVSTWTPRAGSDLLIIDTMNLVPYAEDGILSAESAKGTIGDFVRIHKDEPFEERSSVEYDFFTDVDGAHVKNLQNSKERKVFVTYKKPFNSFGVTSGFTTSTVAVPEEFFNYIAHAAYADFLILQGRVELAQTESVVAEKYLNLELEKLSNINGANTLSRISTHLSRQRRK